MRMNVQPLEKGDEKSEYVLQKATCASIGSKSFHKMPFTTT